MEVTTSCVSLCESTTGAVPNTVAVFFAIVLTRYVYWTSS